MPPLQYFTDMLRKLSEHSGLANEYGLEAAFQRRVFFHVQAILVEVPVTDLLPDRWHDLYGAASPQ